MQYIANLCPDIAGTAVFDARSLVRIFNDSAYFNDSTICSDVTYQWYRLSGSGSHILTGDTNTGILNPDSVTTDSFYVQCSTSWCTENSNVVKYCPSCLCHEYDVLVRHADTVTAQPGSFTVNLYPNPNNGSFHLDINGVNLNTATAQFYVYDMLGEEVENIEVPINNGAYIGSINLGSAITNGLYMYDLKVSNVDKRDKFIVSKY